MFFTQIITESTVLRRDHLLLSPPHLPHHLTPPYPLPLKHHHLPLVHPLCSPLPQPPTALPSPHPIQPSHQRMHHPLLHPLSPPRSPNPLPLPLPLSCDLFFWEDLEQGKARPETGSLGERSSSPRRTVLHQSLRSVRRRKLWSKEEV